MKSGSNVVPLCRLAGGFVEAKVNIDDSKTVVGMGVQDAVNSPRLLWLPVNGMVHATTEWDLIAQVS